jgi:hypothetical protein
MEGYRRIKFKTIDGIDLRGRLYPAAQRGPAVILTPGVSNKHLATCDNNG